MKELSIIDYLTVIRRHIKPIGIGFLVVVFLTPIVCLIIPARYEAVTSLMPTSGSTSSLSSLLSSQSGLPMLSNLTGGLQTEGSTRLWNIITSRSVGTSVVKKLDLGKDIFDDEWDKKKGQWEDPDEAPRPPDVYNYMVEEGIVSFEETEKGLYKIIIRYKDRELVSRIANTFIEAIQEMINDNTFTIAKKNRLFLEEQLRDAESKLVKSEQALREYQNKYGILELESQTELAMTTLMELQAELISVDMQIDLLSQRFSNDTPEINRLKSKKKAIRSQIRDFYSDQVPRPVQTPEEVAGKANPKKTRRVETKLLRLGNLPDLALEYFRLRRNNLIKEKIHNLLIEQHELAKIEEVREDLAFELVDPAIIPREPYFPMPLIFTFVAGMLAIIFGICGAFLIEYIQKNDIRDRLRRVV